MLKCWGWRELDVRCGGLRKGDGVGGVGVMVMEKVVEELRKMMMDVCCLHE